ncbi:hypothetical protein [Aquiflexum gelatinilyticum]|uniref:Transglutaminase-like domain-containing protein n=1 Tax=Aquiflexum gelatinilyticum TaxID=2961943 RepID=A0A9X2P490_9BACT|nr:hypothetical protein [Aquiflexum gelatinilyticum]MCR9014446.1 hypothetical protein [Aquiflexum gelatinilyticum]MCS4435707.1 hypothetical protein [Aquiflexum gelatinilyticum]
MKRFLLLILALSTSYTGIALSNNEKKESLISSNDFIAFWDSTSTKFEKLNIKLQKDFDRYGESEKFLKMLFFRSQQYLLDDYNQYASVEELIETGAFDCVSGSFLMAVFLDRYGFDYDIMETSFHVFLTVNVEGKKVVLESTDGFTGFINDKNEVKAYLTDFEKESKKNPLYLNPEQQLVQNLLQPAIFRAINLQQLKGLELFNRAIFYNNQKEYDIAFKKIKEAETLYPSERISALSRLLQSQLVVASNL